MTSYALLPPNKILSHQLLQPGPDAYRVVPNSSLIVARTATKSNTSRYTLNSRASTYTEVQALLQGRGIDLTHKRFLILQGEVESITQMKHKGTSEHDGRLLEYLEDIIGTAELKAPIETALAEVERLGEARAEKVSRLRLVEKEKAKLEAERKEALAWQKLANEHVGALSRLWQYYLWQCFGIEKQFTAQIVSAFSLSSFRCGADTHHRSTWRKNLHMRENKIKMILRI